jgi:dihydroorotate dehydrogenase (NAD+) catalytic subunit
MGPTSVGMLNAIGIQNPGIEQWAALYGPGVADVPTSLWGSAVGTSVQEFVQVAKGLVRAGVAAVELNLSCPNLETGEMWALSPQLTADVVAAVRAEVDVPIGAKLSPNAMDVSDVAEAAHLAGADWLVLTNTAYGAGVDISTRRPLLSGTMGGYSGAGLKPISLRCVMQVRERLPDVPIVGTGGVRSGEDVVEYLLAGANAVGLGTVHFERPRCAKAILRWVDRWCQNNGVHRVADLTNGVMLW